MPDYYPIFLNLKGRTCLVVGGGEVAERKAGMLVNCGARVRVVSSRFNKAMKSMAARGDIEVENRPFESRDLDGIFLVIAATSDTTVNSQISAEAEKNNILANVVDTPTLGNFIVPSVVNKGDLTIAISTSGKSPALARKIRQDIENNFAPGYAILLEIASKIRRDLLSQGKHIPADAWQTSIDEKLLELAEMGEVNQARERLLANLEKWTKPQ